MFYQLGGHVMDNIARLLPPEWARHGPVSAAAA